MEKPRFTSIVELYAEAQHHCPSRVRAAIISLAFIVPLSMLAFAWLQPVHTPSVLTRDPLAVAISVAARGEYCCSRFSGAISFIGIMVWSATAAIAMTAALLLASLDARRADIVLFSIVGGLTAWLALDDALMLHEGYSPKVFGFTLTHLIPIIGVLPIAWYLDKAEVRVNLPIFALALIALGMSIVVDDVVAGGDTGIFIEDSFKFLGICLWAAFFSLAAIECILRAVGDVTNHPHRGSL